MRYTEFTNTTIDEDWRTTAANIGTAITLGTGGYLASKPSTAPDNKPRVTQPAAQAGEIQRPAAPVQKKAQPRQAQPQSASEHEAFLQDQAKAAGITGAELNHFLAQLSHETLGFRKLIELGTSEYFRKRYDKSGNPRRAKILGNTEPGDGERFLGRGYVQLTGRYNYTQAGRALGIDLVSRPELAADPEVAAKIAIWYWQKRVQPKVDNWQTASVKSVTQPINPGQRGLKSREQHFQKISSRQ
jgi:predicted chitinase